ncbi:hypothetical protein ACWEN3_42285 [Streptomyces sp. NPDC004561]
MTSWLRLKHRSLRLMLVLTTALPAYGTATAYASEPGPPRPSATGHADHEHPGHPGHSDHAGRGHGHEHASGADHTPATPVPTPSDSASASYNPQAATPSRAGSRAGEGRRRPGRPDGPMAEVEGGDDSAPIRDPDGVAAQPKEPETAETPSGSASVSPPPAEAGLVPARPSRQPAGQSAAQQGNDADGPVLRILPLGSGLVLIGLGLGLAFLGLRLRKG